MAKVVGAFILLLGLGGFGTGAWMTWSTTSQLLSGRRVEAVIMGVTVREGSTGTGANRRSANTYSTRVEGEGIACTVSGQWGYEGDPLVIRYTQGTPPRCIADSWKGIVMPLCIAAAGVIPGLIGFFLLRGPKRKLD